ncbi:hypothetical protein AMAG_12358 [Allomyces macrogynus ATCC 38327]|uniref:F-box domain-containing protein n=1 Tax=Allomyces macrogynus (strain ATCC 38327) TaxID=578462 RepID=A0A0L0SXK4_ALLM3|nr:hypothetical protein AMAG_12358 [Allomyces macrogynus ATCC 38327]|eukprot:KNE67293.1 hypothetical protein AMAG_12358 [Allomyces macrogynus ATCC 38327]
MIGEQRDTHKSSAVDATHDEPAPTLAALNQLPYHALYRLAEFMSEPWSSARVDLLHLALAASTLYEPCMTVAIRTGTGFDSPRCRLKLVEPDEVDLGETDVGHLVGVTDEATRRVQYYLILPPRDHHGALMPLVKGSGLHRDKKLCRASRKWSLLPVPLRQRRTFELIGKNPSLALPPHCESMFIYLAAPWRDHQFRFPESLLSLHLMNSPARDVDARRAFATLPAHLKSLMLTYSKLGQLAKIIEQLLPHVPSALTTIVVYSHDAADDDVHGIAELVRRLPCLTSFSMTVPRGRDGIDLVLAALPRTGLKKLSICADHGDQSEDEGPDALDAAGQAGFEAAEGGGNTGPAPPRPTPRFPTTVESLELRVPYPQIRRIGLVGPNFPTATRELNIDVSDWDATMLRTVPLASTLHRLQVFFSDEANIGTIANVFMPRLPPSLKQLDLSESALGSTVVVRALARYLPAQLATLTLADCDISVKDLKQFAGQWPRTLRRLDVSGGLLPVDGKIPHLPKGLRELYV